MSAPQSKPDYVLTVNIFLGSATFTALFFLLQAKDKIQNYEFFITSVAVASILFILVVVGRLNISNERIKSNTPFATLLGGLSIAGFVWIIIILVVLIFQINSLAGFIVGIISLGFYCAMEITIRRSK